jgi:hypothetical protein
LFAVNAARAAPRDGEKREQRGDKDGLTLHLQRVSLTETVSSERASENMQQKNRYPRRSIFSDSENVA